jgi:hypothetical protein
MWSLPCSARGVGSWHFLDFIRAPSRIEAQETPTTISACTLLPCLMISCPHFPAFALASQEQASDVLPCVLLLQLPSRWAAHRKQLGWVLHSLFPGCCNRL